jgi:hypothetical protein
VAAISVGAKISGIQHQRHRKCWLKEKRNGENMKKAASALKLAGMSKAALNGSSVGSGGGAISIWRQLISISVAAMAAKAPASAVGMASSKSNRKRREKRLAIGNRRIISGSRMAAAMAAKMAAAAMAAASKTMAKWHHQQRRDNKKQSAAKIAENGAGGISKRR